MSTAIERLAGLLCVAGLAIGFAGCASTVSTSAFKGEEREVAQAIADLQADATAGNEQRICSHDLASSVVAPLNAARGGCKQAIKNQLTGLDSYELSVKHVQLSGPSTRRAALAQVSSVYAGKTRPSSLLMRKEGGTWKVASLQ